MGQTSIAAADIITPAVGAEGWYKLASAEQKTWVNAT
jgi:hypothetical protein